ncbi:hypothetical protein RFM41_25570 [Mesorhizobium sp. VK25A]|uniref:Glycosyltransferase RgtA/B/C/D-like domain-containing protein n=1 Tax=Mesorhizobium vachelliae TaxID=3072309 RepID=A0ABU5AA75_9HYPH|nr:MULTISPECIES: hypothetical protein [unclassified Mesorhizobium]MDX8534605.1 hypothetical protein [Mesorhizobium sp. VK25D]MDX8547142.1 hypothetical protein [Mesorhizobium sp. VK25A]
MTVALDRPTAHAPIGQVRNPRAWILCLLVLAAAIPWQTRWGVIPDTSWIITMCEQMLAGSRLYVDILEVNPPFTPWMFMPVVAVAHKLGMSPEVAVHAYAYAICLAGLGLAALIARRAGFVENRTLFSLLPLFLALLVIFPGNAFSEREHLGTALFLPLLMLTAWRAAPIEGRTPSLPVALLAGLSASILVLVKPYYALVVLIPALYAAWRRRSIRTLFAVEYWVIGLLCVAYVVAVQYFYPEFLSVIYPMLADTYMRMQKMQALLTTYVPIYMVALATLYLLRPGLPLSPLVTVFTLASLAATVPLIYQAKGWAYHAFPAFSLILAALLLRMAQAAPATYKSPSMAMELGRKMLLAAIIAAAAIPFMQTQKLSGELVAKLEDVAHQPTVALVGADLSGGHPLTRMLGGIWISSYCSDWLGESARYLSGIATLEGDKEKASHYRQIADRYIEGKLAELEAKQPSMIIIEKNDRDWNAELARWQDYVNFLRGYQQIAEDDQVQVLLRNAGTAQAE